MKPSKNARPTLIRLVAMVADTDYLALDVGARDGYFSRMLAEHFSHVTALDLEKPDIMHPRVTSIAGDLTHLDLRPESFDLVFCAEVLEHIPPQQLGTACSALIRVSRRYLLVGVPYRQDIREGRTTCYSCGRKNPPWEHVNRFDKQRLLALFPGFRVKALSFVGTTRAGTNALSALLMDMAGNPYGTYTQDEPCVHCGARLKPPLQRNLPQKLLTKLAFMTKALQRPLQRQRPNWIHILFDRQVP